MYHVQVQETPFLDKETSQLNHNISIIWNRV